MDAASTLKKLAALGTAQNRKVYARHGITGAMFGVSYANLGKLARELQGRHELALELWESANHDARVLATMIADPERLGARELGRWVKALDNYVLTDAFAKLAARSPAGQDAAVKWLADSGEWVSTAGWSTLCWSLQVGAALEEAELRGHLRTIEKRIHGAKNRTRHAMNSALIGIGIGSPALRAEALAAAERIGTVEVDHGATGCKTPDAALYIRKVVEHRGKKQPARKTRTAKR
jgi:3-methyladenine DNA glycosylase AlkD